MSVRRCWRLVLPLLATAIVAVPALAQQPTTSTPGAAGSPSPAQKKPPAKPKPTSSKPAEPPAAATGGVKPTLLGQYGDWGAYAASPGGKKVCFAIAKPASSETVPHGKTRNPAFMFISSRPGEKVTDEVSIVIGYPFKPNTEATAEVGPASFALYTQQDGAWIKNVSEETRMIEALRAGQSAVVKGVSAKGTRSTDTFSLKGFSQALDRSDQECK